MRPDPTRRGAVLGGALLLGATGLTAPARAQPKTGPIYDTAGQTSLRAGARFGWATLDLGNGHFTGVNWSARLPMCSSFKWLLAACVLSRVDARAERLEREIAFGPDALLDYAPTTAAALKAQGGRSARLPVSALCEAAVTLSDNAAANLLLAQVGGPHGLTAWLRAHGDDVTRLDRPEPGLNHSPRGEVRDTTTPSAMLGNLKRILYGPDAHGVLTPASRRRLFDWMLACRTGAHRLPAGLSAGWRVAHKTGTFNLGHVDADGDGGNAGDVGVLLPPQGPPVLIAAYVSGSRAPEADVDRFFATLARSTLADVASYRSAARG
jgi:beta-lactamase class A